MINNMEQFKQYFYLWLCKDIFEDINFKLLEKELSKYLMFNGFKGFFNLDDLYQDYLKKGFI